MDNDLRSHENHFYSEYVFDILAENFVFAECVSDFGE